MRGEHMCERVNGRGASTELKEESADSCRVDSRSLVEEVRMRNQYKTWDNTKRKASPSWREKKDGSMTSLSFIVSQRLKKEEGPSSGIA